MQDHVPFLFDTLVHAENPTMALGLRDRLELLGDPVAAHCRGILRAQGARARHIEEAIRLLATFKSSGDLRLIGRHLVNPDTDVRRTATIALTAHFDVRPIADSAADVLGNEQDPVNQVLLVRLLASTKRRKYQRSLDSLAKRCAGERAETQTPYGTLAAAIAGARTRLTDDQ